MDVSPKPGNLATMKHSPASCNRRSFLRWGATMAAGAPLALACPRKLFAADAATESLASIPQEMLSNARVSIVGCKSYGPEVRAALKQNFDLLGGIGQLVKIL